MWFSRKTGGKQAQNAFDQNLRKIGTFSTCEQFWDLYGHIVFPGEMSSHSDFHLFKEGIKPMWEVSAFKRSCIFGDESVYHSAPARAASQPFQSPNYLLITYEFLCSKGRG